MSWAQRSIGKPPTPVPNAGSATDFAPSPSASSRVRRVPCEISSAEVARSWPMTAACTTCSAFSRPAPVTTASPTGIGPSAIASRSISSPPARLMAPATPAPIQRPLFAAFATTSTSSSVMSPSTTSSCTGGSLAAAGAHDRPAVAERGRLDAKDTRHVRRQPPVPPAEELHRARNEERTYDRDVDEDRRGQAEAELLQADDRAGDEARERREHDEPRGRHDPPGLREPVRDGLLVRLAGVPFLPHPADEEDLVVHRE